MNIRLISRCTEGDKEFTRHEFGWIVEWFWIPLEKLLIVHLTLNNFPCLPSLQAMALEQEDDDDEIFPEAENLSAERSDNKKKEPVFHFVTDRDQVGRWFQNDYLLLHVGSEKLNSELHLTEILKSCCLQMHEAALPLLPPVGKWNSHALTYWSCGKKNSSTKLAFRNETPSGTRIQSWVPWHIVFSLQKSQASTENESVRSLAVRQMNSWAHTIMKQEEAELKIIQFRIHFSLMLLVIVATALFLILDLVCWSKPRRIMRSMCEKQYTDVATFD